MLMSVWERSQRLPEPLQTLVHQHEGLVTAGLPIGMNCEQIVSIIQREVNRAWPVEALETGDSLLALATYLNLDAVMGETLIDEAQGQEFDFGNIVGAPQRVLRDIIRRRGQGPFRQGLLAAYGHRCQVTLYTGEQALEAAHIYSYSEGGEYTNDLRNGLLLRADIHTLFDLGLLKITPESLEVRIMNPLAGTSYAALDGTVLQASVALQPSNEALAQKWAQA